MTIGPSVSGAAIMTKQPSMHTLVPYTAVDAMTSLHLGLLLLLALALVFAALLAFACRNWLVRLQSNVDTDVERNCMIR